MYRPCRVVPMFRSMSMLLGPKQVLVSCKGLQAKYIIRGLQGKMRIGLSVSTVMGETFCL